MDEIVSYEQRRALATVKGRNYLIDAGMGNPVELKRSVDFGVIPGTKKPTLFKSGAEKIAMSYGLMQRYRIESKMEETNTKAPMFFYLVCCSLVKIMGGDEYVITEGFGSANTYEKRNGFNSPWDAANGTLKMAQKRALTSAVIAVSGLSDLFTQDMENEDFMKSKADLLSTDEPDSPISAKQIQRIYAIGGDNGFTVSEVKNKLKILGFASTKDIKQKDYNKVCDAIEGKAETNG